MTSLNPSLNPNELTKELTRLGFYCLAAELDDFLAQASRGAGILAL